VELLGIFIKNNDLYTSLIPMLIKLNTNEKFKNRDRIKEKTKIYTVLSTDCA